MRTLVFVGILEEFLLLNCFRDGGNVGYQDVSTGEPVSGEGALELIFKQGESLV